MPVSEDFRGFGELSSNQPEVIDIHSDFVNALGTRLTESLNLQEEQKETSVMGLRSDSNYVSDKVRCVSLEEPTGVNLDNIRSGKSSVKGKRLLSPMCNGTMDSDNHAITEEYLSPNDHSQSDNYPYQCSLSLPTPKKKLVSAMKGSREKLGVPPKKLSVTWAPDVYDPIPTSASHVSSRPQHRVTSKNKKSGKNKQKGGSGKATTTRGAKGKEKKKPRKYSGYSSSSPTFSYLDNNYLDMEDDDKVGKSDPYCGPSFLKNSRTGSMHFPLAEAT